MTHYFNLAHGTKPLEFSGGYLWPYDIDVCFEPVSHPIAFSEGVGHGAAGCAVSASEALEPKWKEHFKITNSFWLIPHIENLAKGIPLPQEEILVQFQDFNGKQPTSYESKFA
jgi:hypothetical protein